MFLHIDLEPECLFEIYGNIKFINSQLKCIKFIYYVGMDEHNFHTVSLYLRIHYIFPWFPFFRCVCPVGLFSSFFM